MLEAAEKALKCKKKVPLTSEVYEFLLERLKLLTFRAKTCL